MKQRIALLCASAFLFAPASALADDIWLQCSVHETAENGSWDSTWIWVLKDGDVARRYDVTDRKFTKACNYFREDNIIYIGAWGSCLFQSTNDVTGKPMSGGGYMKIDRSTLDLDGQWYPYGARAHKFSGNCTIIHPQPMRENKL